MNAPTGAIDGADAQRGGAFRFDVIVVEGYVVALRFRVDAALEVAIKGEAGLGAVAAVGRQAVRRLGSEVRRLNGSSIIQEVHVGDRRRGLAADGAGDVAGAVGKISRSSVKCAGKRRGSGTCSVTSRIYYARQCDGGNKQGVVADAAHGARDATGEANRRAGVHAKRIRGIGIADSERGGGVGK